MELRATRSSREPGEVREAVDVGPRGASAQVTPRCYTIGAYVLLGDPDFLVKSLSSYYDSVDRLVVIHDEDDIGWTGRPLRVEECRRLVRSIDHLNKVEWVTGSFHDPGMTPLDLETVERNLAVDALAGVDWILQVDSDEVFGNVERFLVSLDKAHAAGRDALYFPAHWLYGRCTRSRYLERCRRFWGISGAYPGPVAIRSGTVLELARQCRADPWRVDFAPMNTDPAHPRTTVVDETIESRDGLWHFSWVRPEETLRAKSQTSGHVDDMDWGAAIDEWSWRCRHPLMTSLGTPLRRSPATVGAPTWLRAVTLPPNLR